MGIEKFDVRLVPPVARRRLALPCFCCTVAPTEHCFCSPCDLCGSCMKHDTAVKTVETAVEGGTLVQHIREHVCKDA